MFTLTVVLHIVLFLFILLAGSLISYSWKKNVLLHKVQYYLFPFLPPFYLFICSGAQLITVFSLNKNKLVGSSVQEYAILFWTNEWERLCKGIGEKEESGNEGGEGVFI